MERIQRSLLALQDTLGIEHAQVSKRLYSDGAELLGNVAEVQAPGGNTPPTHGDRVRLPTGYGVSK